MTEPPEDLEHLVHEALTQLNWGADAKRIAARIWRLNIGLPREDEFSVVCGWLGQCELIHKLDQKQTPRQSFNSFQVPDLLAIFRVQTRRIPVLIEVKSKKDKILSFRPDYYEKLKNYADSVGLPLLIAWKFHGMWVLFDSSHLQKARSNFNVRFDVAIRENLLGVLAGDFSYSLYPNSGLNLRIRKDELLETMPSGTGYTEQWIMTIEDAYFTNGKREEIHNLPSEVQALFLSWDLEGKEEHSGTHILMSFIVPEEMQLFAHMALVNLLNFQTPTGQSLNWRTLLNKSNIVRGIADFAGAVRSAMDRNVVRTVLHLRPRTQPDFLHGT
ncbi:MAG TPA: restriction endonuclease [Candidatus Binatia bacterium]|jgi:Holliday junction resolvase|nr:restriction endonuclease [Candidatus Binatia bacterium]